MRRFFGFWLFFLILGGALIYFQKNHGWLSFFGQIPGDIIIRREGRILYLPVASSFFVTALLSLLFIFFSKKKPKE